MTTPSPAWLRIDWADGSVMFDLRSGDTHLLAPPPADFHLPVSCPAPSSDHTPQ